MTCRVMIEYVASELIIVVVDVAYTQLRFTCPSLL